MSLRKFTIDLIIIRSRAQSGCKEFSTWGTGGLAGATDVAGAAGAIRTSGIVIGACSAGAIEITGTAGIDAVASASRSKRSLPLIRKQCNYFRTEKNHSLIWKDHHCRVIGALDQEKAFYLQRLVDCSSCTLVRSNTSNYYRYSVIELQFIKAQKILEFQEIMSGKNGFGVSEARFLDKEIV